MYYALCRKTPNYLIRLPIADVGSSGRFLKTEYIAWNVHEVKARKILLLTRGQPTSRTIFSSSYEKKSAKKSAILCPRFSQYMVKKVSYFRYKTSMKSHKKLRITQMTRPPDLIRKYATVHILVKNHYLVMVESILDAYLSDVYDRI